VTITDATGVPTAGSLVPRIYYRKPAGSWFSQPGVLTSGGATNGTWDFTIVVADLGGLMIGDVVEYYVIAQDLVVPTNIGSNPGGVVATDVNTVITHPGAPNSTTAVSSLSGTYSVGAGGDFTTLTAAVNAYNNSCLTGPVVFNLIDASYPGETFPIEIQANSFASAVNTLTIKPNATATVEGTITGCIISLRGADHVILDGSNSGSDDRSLTLINNAITANSCVVCVQSLGAAMGAENNTIKNLQIQAGEIGSTTTLHTFGIWVGGTAISNTGTGADNDNLLLQNNAIRKARYGIYARGLATATANDNLRIIGNEIGSDDPTLYVTFRGLDITYAEGMNIEGNRIFNLIQALSASNAAIDIGAGVNNSAIVRNDIQSVYSNSTGGWGAYGINFNTSTSVNNNLIANNFISDIRGVNYSSGSTTFNGFGIRLVGGTNTKVYNNSVNMFGDITIISGSPTQPNSAAFLVTSTVVTGLDVRNNIFRNVQTFVSGTPKIYSIWVPASYSGFSTINNNAYFGTDGPPGNPTTYHVGRAGTVDYTTLAAWQAITAQEANSVFVDPVFVSPTNLHLVPGQNPLLQGGAVPLPEVLVDIDGSARGLPRTIGAHELNLCAVSISSVTSSGACGGQSSGSIQIAATCMGCTGTLEYSIDNGVNWETSGNFVNLAPGNYTVVVRDSGNPACQDVWSANPVEVEEFPNPVVTLNISNNNSQWCSGELRTLTGNPSGGSYSSSGPVNLIGNQATATGPGAITITYFYTDQNGCSDTASLAFTGVAGPVLSATVVEPSTCFSLDGEIDLSISGGVGPFTYTWTTPDGQGLVQGQQDQSGLSVRHLYGDGNGPGYRLHRLPDQPFDRTGRLWRVSPGCFN
jgi:trimeric autotransporter adhesin